MDAFARPNPVEEHCMLVLKSAWEDVSSRMSEFDKGLRSLAGLPFLVPESSIAGDAANVDLPQITWSEARQLLLTGATPAKPEKPKILAIEFSTQAAQAQTTAKQPAQQEGKVEETFWMVENVNETAVDRAGVKEAVTLFISNLGLNVERIKDDAFMAKHTTMQFKRKLDNKIDGLETSLVRHFADSQQHLVDEIALLKSQIAEMVDCLKVLRDDKKGEGTSSKKRRLL
ncbi:hypothetical protein F511_19166 [Dorcoceras hygrometricum]|uniref:Uncharacterized protein n=1 Tax=Dorcoceras hygrometricum TaxID=472368 RepID=A0A2Z7C2F6_9LAMI|nr:hypothetical protein F511_19166 [Dorcoceras hygrometricum]